MKYVVTIDFPEVYDLTESQKVVVNSIIERFDSELTHYVTKVARFNDEKKKEKKR